MTLYEVNQQAYEQLPKMTKAELEEAKEKLSKFLYNSYNTYYMMLNHDKKYYTVFVIKKEINILSIADEIIDVSKSLGQIKGIEVTDQGMVEIWISNSGECNMYALFPYDKGVIET